MKDSQIVPREQIKDLRIQTLERENAQLANTSRFMGTTLDTAWRFCANLVQSRIVPRGITTTAQAFYVVMKGLEMGVGPVSALDNIHIIEGKTSLSAKLMLARMHAAGFKTFPKRCDAEVAEIEVTSPEGRTGTVKFTMAEADHITFHGKKLTDKDNWRNYPADMLFARAASRAVNRYCPESVIGAASLPDELGAVVDAEGAIEVEPESVTTVTTGAEGPVIPAYGPIRARPEPPPRPTGSMDVAAMVNADADRARATAIDKAIASGDTATEPESKHRSALDPKIRARLIEVAREAHALNAEGDVIHLEPLWAQMIDHEGEKTIKIDEMNEAEGLVLGGAIKDSLAIPASMLND